MQGYEITVAGATLTALASGALCWPELRLLAVSDLHLGKSERLARLGRALLPPYEIDDTLARLDAVIAACDPRLVVCLGDTFDDLAAALPEAARLWLMRMMAERRWVWIAGNHDPAPVDLAGEQMAEFVVGPLVFRHIAQREARGEVSGHYHPKLRLAGQARRCFLVDGSRVILPAFGTYTGGLDAGDPALAGLMGPGALAVLTGQVARPVPL